MTHDVTHDPAPSTPAPEQRPRRRTPRPRLALLSLPKGTRTAPAAPSLALPLAVLDAHLSCGAIVTYCHLLRQVDNRGVTSPKVDDLSHTLAAHRNTVRAYLSELETCGCITRIGATRGRSTQYRIASTLHINAQPTVHLARRGAQPEVHLYVKSEANAQPTVHLEEENAQPTVHLGANGEGANAQPTVHLAPPLTNPPLETTLRGTQGPRRRPSTQSVDGKGGGPVRATPPPSPRPTPAQRHAATTIAEDILTVQGRTLTDGARARALLKLSESALEHIVLAYAGDPRQVTTAKVYRCILYLLTKPFFSADHSRITAKAVGEDLGAWLDAGEPVSISERQNAVKTQDPPAGLHAADRFTGGRYGHLVDT